MADPRMQLTVKWLSRNFNLNRQIADLKRRQENEPMANISQYEQTFSGAVGNLQEMKMINYAERNARIEELTLEQHRVCKEIRKAVSYVDDPTLWSLLTDRYIECMEWKTIADKYCFSMRHVFNLHGKALPIVYRHLPKGVKNEE